MKKKFLLLAVLTTASYVFVINANGDGNGETGTKAESRKPQKVYSVYTEGLMTSGAIMTDISRAEYLGMKCIKGISYGNWTEGKTVYIPVERVRMIIEFDSMEDYNTSKKKIKPSSRYGSRSLGLSN